MYTDIAVIGGGVIGTSAAYYLSKKNLDVAILERENIASGASGACDGFIFVQSKKDTDIIYLTLKSLAMFEDLSDSLSYNLEYNNCGGLVLYCGDYGRKDIKVVKVSKIFWDLLGKKDSKFKKSDFIEIIDHKKVRQLEPYISGPVAFGTYCSYEGQVNPLAVNIGYWLAARKNGVKLYSAEEVKSFKIRNARIEKLITDTGRQIYAREFLICAGAWTGLVGRYLGIDIPVLPRRGTLVVTEVIPNLVNHGIIDYDYICCKFDINKKLGFTMEQTEPGNLLIGSTREFSGFNDDIDYGNVSKILARAASLFPELNNIDVIRMFNGFRPYSPDGRPFIGLIPCYKNLWVASGHEGDGIALSPVTGKLVSTLIEKKITQMDGFDNEIICDTDLFYNRLYDRIKDFRGINIRKFSPQGRVKFKDNKRRGS